MHDYVIGILSRVCPAMCPGFLGIGSMPPMTLFRISLEIWFGTVVMKLNKQFKRDFKGIECHRADKLLIYASSH